MCRINKIGLNYYYYLVLTISPCETYTCIFEGTEDRTNERVVGH